MNLQEFSNKVLESLQEYFGEGYSGRINKVKKNNGIILTGISVFKNGNNLSPTVYMEGFYSRYKDGEVLAQLVHEIILIFEKNSANLSLDISFFESYEKVKDNIVCKLINYERNKELLMEVPYEMFNDLAIVYYYLLPDGILSDSGESVDGCMASILIHSTHLAMWKIDEDIIKADALENTERIMGRLFQGMDQVLLSMMMEKIMLQDRCPSSEEDIEEKAREILSDMFGNYTPPMYILSNTSKQNGAAALLYDGIMKDISEAIKSGFYVLPSSIHEVIIVPDNICDDVDTLKGMVKEVNSRELDPSEVLSENIYYYSSDKGVLEVI